MFKIHPLRLSLLVLVATIGLVSGCATLESIFGSPLAPEVVNLAVAAAVGTNKVTAIARAQKIKDIATALLADETALTSLSTLEADVNTEIAKLSLPGPDLILAQSLSAALELSAQAYLTASGKSVAVATASVAISTVLNQVIAEAKAFGAV